MQPTFLFQILARSRKERLSAKQRKHSMFPRMRTIITSVTLLGSLQLPPTGIKDPESAGSCSLSFTVCSAQPKSVELAFGDPNEDEGAVTPKTAQRFLLGPGDMFRVLPGNSYRLENHSKTTDAFLSWTIIRPRRNAPDS